MNGTLSFYNASLVVGTLKPYYMKRISLNFLLTGSEDAKTSGASTHTQQSPL